MRRRRWKAIKVSSDAFLEQCNVSRKHRAVVTQQRVTARTPSPHVFIVLQIISQVINLKIKILNFFPGDLNRN